MNERRRSTAWTACLFAAAVVVALDAALGGAPTGPAPVHAVAPLPPPVRTYGLAHHETTGITTFLVEASGDRRRRGGIPVEYHPASQRERLRLLYGLKPDVFLPNTDDYHRPKPCLFVVGRLYPQVRRTPDGPGRAMPEEYQEFQLLDWYLQAPFIEMRFTGKADEPDHAHVLRHSLRPGDFGHGVEPPRDLRRHVRPAPVAKRP